MLFIFLKILSSKFIFMKYDLIVIGGGASGLISAITALKSGVKNVIILERQNELGGNLNLFIHNGFGEKYLNKKVTGPEFASFLIEEYLKLGGKFKVNTSVLEVNENRVVKYVNSIDGIISEVCDAIIVASGCREKYTGRINIPIHKYSGVFTTVASHRLVNFEGYIPGKNIVLYGNNIWTFILARRLLIEGANIKSIIIENNDIGYEQAKIIEGFDIKINNNSKVIEVGGVEKLEWIKISNEKIFKEKCDALILSIAYLPEVNFINIKGVEKSNEFLKVFNHEIYENIFCCGTVEKGLDLLFDSIENSIEVGKIVGQKLLK